MIALPWEVIALVVVQGFLLGALVGYRLRRPARYVMEMTPGYGPDPWKERLRRNAEFWTEELARGRAGDDVARHLLDDVRKAGG